MGCERQHDFVSSHPQQAGMVSHADAQNSSYDYFLNVYHTGFLFLQDGRRSQCGWHDGKHTTTSALAFCAAFVCAVGVPEVLTPFSLLIMQPSFSGSRSNAMICSPGANTIREYSISGRSYGTIVPTTGSTTTGSCTQAGAHLWCLL